MDIIILGIQDAFTLTTILTVAAGVCLGIVVGAIPHISTVMDDETAAVVMPVTDVLCVLRCGVSRCAARRLKAVDTPARTAIV